MAEQAAPSDVFHFDPAEVVPELDSFVAVALQSADGKTQEVMLVPKEEAAPRPGEPAEAVRKRLGDRALRSHARRARVKSLLGAEQVEKLADEYRRGADTIAEQAASLVLPHALRVYFHVFNEQAREHPETIKADLPFLEEVADDDGKLLLRFVPERFDSDRIMTHVREQIRQSILATGGPEGLAEWTLSNAVDQVLDEVESAERKRLAENKITPTEYVQAFRARAGDPDQGLAYWVDYMRDEAMAQLARGLVWGWGLRQRSLAEIEQLLGLRSATGGVTKGGGGYESGFTPSALSIFSDPHSQAFMRGVWAASNGELARWNRRPDTPPYFQDPQTSVVVFVGEKGGAEQLTSAEAASAWQQVLTLNDDQVSTFIICMGKWFAETAGGDTKLTSSRVHVADILAFRGVKKHHKGGYRREQKEEARDHILMLNNIWVRSNEQIWEQIGRKRRQKTVSVKSRLVEVAIESERDLFGEETPYAFRIRPGEWAVPYLGEHNRMTALLLRPIMAYDPRQGVGRMAMRLGIYLTMQWRIRAGHNTFAQPWLVRSLLEGACVPIEADSRLYARFRDHVEGALDKLRDDGVITSWEYQRWDEENLPARGWFKEWLKWTVAITPPVAVRQQYAEIPMRARRAINAAKAGAAAAAAAAGSRGQKPA